MNPSIAQPVDASRIFFSPHRRDVTSNGQWSGGDSYNVPAVVATDDTEIVAYELGAFDDALDDCED